MICNIIGSFHSCLGNVWNKQTEKIKKDLLKGLNFDGSKNFHKKNWSALPLALKKQLTQCEI